MMIKIGATFDQVLIFLASAESKITMFGWNNEKWKNWACKNIEKQVSNLHVRNNSNI